MARGKKSGAQATATTDPVTIQYNGNTISQFTDKGSVKLKCSDKRMLSDVEVDYNVENYEPSIVIVPDGDVNIRYNNNLIYSLSDTGRVTIPVRGKRVEHDIELEYTKPAGQTIGNVLTFTNNTSDERGVISNSIDGDGCIIVNNQIGSLNAESNTTVNGIVLCYLANDDKYYVKLSVDSSSDNLNVTVNGTLLSYNSGSFGGGFYRFTSSPSDNPITGQSYNVVVTDKE